MIKTATGEVHEDGSPKFHFELTQDEVDAGLSVAFATGPVSGSWLVTCHGEAASYVFYLGCIPADLVCSDRS